MAWILLMCSDGPGRDGGSVDGPSLGYKAASVAIMLGACAASVYLADGRCEGRWSLLLSGWYGLDRLRAYRGLLVRAGDRRGADRPRYLGARLRRLMLSLGRELWSFPHGELPVQVP